MACEPTTGDCPERRESVKRTRPPLGTTVSRPKTGQLHAAGGEPLTRGVGARRSLHGHSNPSVANRYRHQLDGQLAEDAKRLDEYLTGAAAGKVVRLATGAPSGAHRAETA
jgi:hypothetical protein